MKLIEINDFWSNTLPEGWELITEGKKRKKAKDSFKVMQDNKQNLTAEERKECMDRKCVWNFHPSGPTPAVWKGKDSKGKLWYVTNTHRAYNKATTLKGAIGRYHAFIKGTA